MFSEGEGEGLPKRLEPGDCVACSLEKMVTIGVEGLLPGRVYKSFKYKLVCLVSCGIFGKGFPPSTPLYRALNPPAWASAFPLSYIYPQPWGKIFCFK